MSHPCTNCWERCDCAGYEERDVIDGSVSVVDCERCSKCQLASDVADLNDLDSGADSQSHDAASAADRCPGTPEGPGASGAVSSGPVSSPGQPVASGVVRELPTCDKPPLRLNDEEVPVTTDTQALKRTTVCPRCRGIGNKESASKQRQRCVPCKGTGFADGELGVGVPECEECNGLGWMPDAVCELCRGFGVVADITASVFLLATQRKCVERFDIQALNDGPFNPDEVCARLRRWHPTFACHGCKHLSPVVAELTRGSLADTQRVTMTRTGQTSVPRFTGTRTTQELVLVCRRGGLDEIADRLEQQEAALVVTGQSELQQLRNTQERIQSYALHLLGLDDAGLVGAGQQLVSILNGKGG